MAEDDRDNPYERILAPGAFNMPKAPGLTGVEPYGGFGSLPAAGTPPQSRPEGYAAPPGTAGSAFNTPQDQERAYERIAPPAQEAVGSSQGSTGAPPPPPPGGPLGFISPVQGGSATQAALDQMRAKGGVGGYMASILGHGPQVGPIEGMTYGSYIPDKLLPLLGGAQNAQSMMAHLLYGEQMMRERLDIREQKREEYEQHVKEKQAQGVEDLLNTNKDAFSGLFPGLYDQSGQAHVDPHVAPTVMQLIDQTMKAQMEAKTKLTAIDKEFKGAGYTGADDPKWIQEKQTAEDSASYDPSLQMAIRSAVSPKDLSRIQQQVALVNQRGDITLRNWTSRIDQVQADREKQLPLIEGMRARLMRLGESLKEQNPNAVNHEIINARSIISANEAQVSNLNREADGMLHGNDFLMLNKQQQQNAMAAAAKLRATADELRLRNQGLIQQVEKASRILSTQPTQAPGKQAISQELFQKAVKENGAEWANKHFIQSGQ